MWRKPQSVGIATPRNARHDPEVLGANQQAVGLAYEPTTYERQQFEMLSIHRLTANFINESLCVIVLLETLRGTAASNDSQRDELSRGKAGT